MAKESEGRRSRLTITALDPNPDCPDGSKDGNREVYISQARLLAVGKRSLGQAKEAAYLVPDALQEPTSVFEGLRWDEDEPPDGGVGWRCYCTTPNCCYSTDGTKRDPYPRQVFLVFVNDEGVAYNWRWERADQDNPGYPQKHETRFKKRLMP